MRVVPGSGGRPNGMAVGCTLPLVGTVCLVVPFAKQFRAEGLGSDAGVGAFFRRPSGLRGRSLPRGFSWRVITGYFGPIRTKPPISLDIIFAL